MSVYPLELVQAAKNLLDNNDLVVLFRHRLNELNDDILYSDDEKSILKAHAEYNSIKGFAQWIEQLGKQSGRATTNQRATVNE